MQKKSIHNKVVKVSPSSDRKGSSIEIHNEEVREIMKEIPGSIIRWGLAIIFMIFVSIIIGSYYFQFKEIVSAPLVITTSNPPAPIISKASGRITHWFVSDGQKVEGGDNIALIKNSTNIEDFYRAENIVLQLDSLKIKDNLDKAVLPEKLELGELQDVYNQLYNNRNNYKGYIESNFLPQKIELLRQQMVKQEQHYQLTLHQQKMMEEELEITRKGLKRYESMLNKGGVSEVQIEEARGRVIQSERAYTSFIATVKTTEINIISQNRSLLELQEQHYKEVEQFEQNISDNIRALKNQFKNWRENYLLSSPINGTVTLTTFWSENHVVNAGERLATIVPTDSSVIICRAIVPSSGIGKVEIGQQVNIKLTGYPYMEYGMLNGEVSAVSLVPEKEGYVVEIRLNEGMKSSYSEQLKLVQEMDGTAEIIADEMRMIYRFINPLKTLIDK
jgi:multidrug resistance efflux pump